MSVWTYVYSEIKCEAPMDALRKIDFGREVLFESPQEVWNDCELNPQNYLPTGSEGSLQVKIEIGSYPNSKGIYKATIKICGNLRDYAHEHYVVQWFIDKVFCLRDVHVKSARIDATGLGHEKWFYTASV